jgi:DNA-binding XRE family transcriptional regulator
VARDDLDAIIDEFAAGDSGLPTRVAAILERRELLRQLAALRREQGLTQVELAERMGTSQGQITRLETGADTRLSTVERYAAALGVKVTWHLEPAPTAKTA